jgi:hypothetical protein
VKGSTTIGDAITDTLTIYGTTTINANATFNGNATFVNAPTMSGNNISVDSVSQSCVNGLDTALGNKANQIALTVGLASKQDVISGSSSVTCGAFTSNSIVDNGNLTVKGNTTLGDLVGLDTLTINGTATFTNAPYMSGANISANSISQSSVNGLETALGNKASQSALTFGLSLKQDAISGTSALTCGAFTSSSIVDNGNLTVKGNTVLGDASTDTLTINGITTFNSTPYLSGGHITTGTILKSAVNGLTTALDSKVDSTDFASWVSGTATKHNTTFTGVTSSVTAIKSTNTTQLATTEFVQTEIANLVGGAPLALNTLSEIAAALNNDANLNSTLTNAIALKASQSSLVAYQDSTTLALAGKQIAGTYCDASSLQTLGGIKTFTSPIVTSGSSITGIPQTAITGLATTLTGYQPVGTYCDATTAQTLGGIKQFTSPPVMSGASIATSSIPQSSINALSTTLAGYQPVGTYCDATTAQTLGGIKTFSSAPVMSGASITTNTIPQASVVGLVSALSSTGTATNIAGGVASQIPYQSGVGTTLFIPNGTAGQVLSSNGLLAPSWITASGGGGGGTTVTIADTNVNGTYYPTFVNGSGTGKTVYADIAGNSFSINPNTGLMKFSNSLNIKADSVCLGASAGATQGIYCTAIGALAGNSQGRNSTALGYGAGQIMGTYSTAYGAGAGANMGNQSCAFGMGSGSLNMSHNATAVGTSSGNQNLAQYATAIGYYAGGGTVSGLGLNSVAIGAFACQNSGVANSICINASGVALNTTQAGCFIKPMRGVALGLGVGVCKYDTTTFELVYSTT